MVRVKGPYRPQTALRSSGWGRRRSCVASRRRSQSPSSTSRRRAFWVCHKRPSSSIVRVLLNASVSACLLLVPNLDLPAICSPKFKPGPPTDEAQVLSDRLNEVLVS